MFLKWVDNAVAKGEIARNEQFLLFPECFLQQTHKNQGLFKKGLNTLFSDDETNYEWELMRDYKLTYK